MTPGRRPRRPPIDPGSLDAAGARRVAFTLLAQKAWSRRELGRRLERRGAPAEVAAGVVADLGERGYLDDTAFARWWAQARAQGRRVGSVRLRQELIAKGIPLGLVTAAIAAAFEETPELDRALEAGRRRLVALARGRRGVTAARLGDYLMRRGYPPAVSARVVRTLLRDEADAAAPDPDDT